MLGLLDILVIEHLLERYWQNKYGADYVPPTSMVTSDAVLIYSICMVSIICIAGIMIYMSGDCTI